MDYGALWTTVSTPVSPQPELLSGHRGCDKTLDTMEFLYLGHGNYAT